MTAIAPPRMRVTVWVCSVVVGRGIVNINVPYDGDADLTAFKAELKRYLDFEGERTQEASFLQRKIQLFDPETFRWGDLVNMGQLTDCCQLFVFTGPTGPGSEIPRDFPPPRTAALTADLESKHVDSEWWEKAIEEEPSLLVIRILVTEFVGTLLHVWLTTCALIYASLSCDPASPTCAIDNITPATVHSASILALILSFSHYSGADLNPAVTVGMYVARKLTWPLATLAIIMQLLGAVVATGLALAMTPGSDEASFGMFKDGAVHVVTTGPHPFSKGQAFLSELLSSFFIVFVALTMVRQRYTKATENKTRLQPHRVEMALATAAAYFSCFSVFSAAYPSTSNPARAIAIAAVAQDHGEGWRELWIFAVTPLLGGFLAGVAFRVAQGIDPPARLSEAHADADADEPPAKPAGTGGGMRPRGGDRAPAADPFPVSPAAVKAAAKSKTINVVDGQLEARIRIAPDSAHAAVLDTLERWSGLKRAWVADDFGVMVTLSYQTVVDGAFYKLEAHADADADEPPAKPAGTGGGMRPRGGDRAPAADPFPVSPAAVKAAAKAKTINVVDGQLEALAPDSAHAAVLDTLERWSGLKLAWVADDFGVMVTLSY
ncbi:Aquaporin PIP1-1 [Diplonema papillatum]|nr:Aquaporin PIP1-1 [Diplonema papillatum]